MPELIVFFISITAVILGADWLGNAATYIAHRLELPRIVIGATIVSLATTLPEIAISTLSGLEGSPEIGLGTVLGSPFANLGLIFGILLIFTKPEINKAYFSRNIQFFLIAIFLVFAAFIGGSISPIFSLVLILFGIFYLFIQTVIGKHEEGLVEKLEHRVHKVLNFFSESKNYHQIFYLVVGSILLVMGAHFLVGSASILANILNLPQIVIGVVLVAFGTSIPELVITIDSVLKKHTGLSTGNLFGASVLNLTIAVGLGGLFNGATIKPTELYLTIGALAMICSISLLYVFDKLPSKLIGVLLICLYLAYLAWFSNLEIALLSLF